MDWFKNDSNEKKKQTIPRYISPRKISKSTALQEQLKLRPSYDNIPTRNLNSFSRFDIEIMAKIIYEKYLETLSNQQKCMLCGTIYREIDNFMWKCRKHTMNIDKGNIYNVPLKCCENQYSNGCTMTDHKSSDTASSYAIIPFILVNLRVISIRNEGVLKNYIDKDNEWRTMILYRRSKDVPLSIDYTDDPILREFNELGSK